MGYNQGANNPSWRGGKTKHVCPTCGKEFLHKDKPDKPQIFCSQKCSKLGNNNPQWKGNDVGYKSLHHWGYRHIPKPETCRKCGGHKKLDLANISGEYKRDVSDWIYLCRKCHMEMDGITKRLIEFGKSGRKYGYKKCKNCGKQFMQKTKTHSFCNQSCSTTYHNKFNRVYEKGRFGGKFVSESEKSLLYEKATEPIN